MCVLDPLTEAHMYGWWAILYLQRQWGELSECMLFLSNVGDPRYAFLIYFPVAFCISRSTGTRVLWTACVAEWLNAVLKLILHGDRPYWWVGETYYYLDKKELEDTLPKQYYLTCETGPGSPSGHAMVTSAVLYVLVRAVLDLDNKSPSPLGNLKEDLELQEDLSTDMGGSETSEPLKPKKVFLLSNESVPDTSPVTNIAHEKMSNPSMALQIAVWTGFAVILLAVNVSRVYIATHFPHQVIAGTFGGIYLVEIMRENLVPSPRLTHYLFGSLVGVVGIILTYHALTTLGYDPLWSIPMAQKWCANPDWVHPDTSLFFAVVRDVSCLAGFGCSVYIAEKFCNKQKSSSALSIPKLLQIVSSLFVTVIMEYIKLPQDSDAVFYMAAFCKFFIMMSVVVLVIPQIFDKFGVEEQEEKQKS